MNDEFLPNKKYQKISQLAIEDKKFDSISHEEIFKTRNCELVFVDSTKENLKKLFSSLQTNVSVFIEGDLGIGKTALVEHLAQVANKKLIKYQMDDFMDSKALIGSYVCSDMPGEFIWKPGPLYQALLDGYWLLLEDFDNSTVDSISLLINVLETNTLKLNEKSVRCHHEFRLILTQRTNKNIKSTNSNLNYLNSLLRLSRCLKFKELNKDEVVTIVVTKYKKLDKIADKLYDLYKSLDFHELNCDPKLKLILSKEARVLSLRDLLKVCNRLNGIENYQDISRVYMLINDIMDCFVSFISNKFIRIELAIAIGAKFNFNRDEITSFISNYKPSLLVKEAFFTCGRVTLTRESNETVKRTNDTFVYTRASLILLEKLSRCIECNESILLCGETGVGKTSVLQHLAKIIGKKLSVINLNQQTESGDLLGSFKPVDIKLQIKELKEKFENLFEKTFLTEKNEAFLSHIHACYSKSNWSYVIALILHAINSAIKKCTSDESIKDWKALKYSVRKVEKNLEMIKNKFTFKFFEGALTKAIVNGEWIILDEINLASSETLQFLGTLLEEKYSSIILHEKGDTEPLKRHSNFRLFAAMNPASDIGKRNLPLSIRNRFTEIFVDELDERNDLCLMVNEYLRMLSPSNSIVNSIVDFYFELKNDFIKTLTNGIGYHPTYSLRTLCRALRHAAKNPCNNLLASVYDGICLSFLTDLNRESSTKLENFIKKKLSSKNSKEFNPVSIQRAKPNVSGESYVKIEGFWLLKGEQPEKHDNNNFIFTNSVKENLKRIARVCSARLPCLLQGDTSIGKTSLIKWLANETQNTLIRINNHDHTDLQEYIGSYVIDTNGKLTFKEGLLVEAMRKGYWILLDELNLASSEVLEALNRVLDDNREIFIPEIQETVKAHPRFILFATQNPPGKYAGRKQLSRAFRNRFIELHFDEIPSDELSFIVEKKCKIPSSYSTLLVKTMTELQTHRSQTGIFAGKNSLITLRDLFRWADRYSKLENIEFDDWKQYLAEQGFLLLSGSCRSQEDVLTIHECIQKVFKKKIDLSNLSNPTNLCKPIISILNEFQSYCENKYSNYVWTPNSRRLALLAGLAYHFNEPFLLVGDTGLGKTTICQMFADYNSKYLHIVNCHMHSEAADFLGSIRPIRNQLNDSNKLFEWHDGPLVTAVKNGQDFLIDEISLAEDSVLERLNSLLESDRSLLLAENSSSNASDVIYAHERFRLSATMNPSGDFGKKELSPALRNRFTEIWCPSVSSLDDYRLIIDELLSKSIDSRNNLIEIICDFVQWIKIQAFFRQGVVSFRDLINWIKFINAQESEISSYLALVHGACLIFIDSFSIESNNYYLNARNLCLEYLFDKISKHSGQNLNDEFYNNLSTLNSNECDLKCGPFKFKKSSLTSESSVQFNKYSLNSPTTSFNVMRILRCLTMPNPIMLEGSPGVGKTSIVQALAHITNNKVVRINLSDQTDLSELFGSDLPSPDSTGKQQIFSWYDGPFLMALKEGSWIILDEINLASQSVLEGLNSCLDHRGEVYIAELDRKFEIKKNQTRVFACQNPYKQGGGRKGLPKSFLNRFSKVYVDQMTADDLFFIIKNQFASINDSTLRNMIEFNERINKEVCVDKQWGLKGSPWEFNLRDLTRWCEIMIQDNTSNPGSYVYLIFASRFRLKKDRDQVYEIFNQIFGYKPYTQLDTQNFVHFTDTHFQIGQSFYRFSSDKHFDCNKDFYQNQYQLTQLNLKQLEAVLKCIQMNWMVVLVGQSCVGKTNLVRLLSRLCSHSLIEISVNNSTDTSDLLGGYSKSYLNTELIDLIDNIKSIYMDNIRVNLKNKAIFEELSKNTLELESLRAIFESQHDNHDAENIKDLLKKVETHVEYVKNDDICKGLINIKKKLEKNSTQDVKFEWIESSLVKAIKQGDWVLIDNANFCNPSVLDRLNPLLEQYGSLTITEKCAINGKLETIKPHKGFRLFLAMNESFGEISRPMRNRGIEIYMDEIDLFSVDASIYLNNVFSIDQQKSIDFSIELLIETLKRLNNNLNTNFLPSVRFKDALKIAHIIKDYWSTTENTFQTSMQLAITELYPNFNDFVETKLINYVDLYSVDVYKFVKLPFYRYLAQFPLHKEFFNTINTIKIGNDLVEQVNLTQFIKLWIKNVPLKHNKLFKEIFFNQKNGNIQNLQEIYVKFFGNIKNFESKLKAIEKSSKLSLTEESFCVHNNYHLVQTITNDTNIEEINKLQGISNNLMAFLNLILAKYRVDNTNSTNDSLLNLVESGAFDSLLNGDLKYHSIRELNQFFTGFLECLFNSITSNEDLNLSSNDVFQLNLHLYSFERFRNQCTAKYNQTLTFPYLKYYWNLFRHSINALHTLIPKCFSEEFKITFDLINNDFYFDDKWYNFFIKFWRLIKHEISSNLISNEDLSKKFKILNDYLVNISFHVSNPAHKNEKLIEYLIVQQSNQQFECSLDNNIDFIEKHFERIDQERVKKWYISDAYEFIKSLFIKHQTYPIKSFTDVLQLHQNNDYKSTPSNLLEVITNNDRPFKNIIQLFTRLANSLYQKFKDFEEILIENSNLALTINDDDYLKQQEQKYEFGEILKQFNLKNLRMHRHLNVLHYDWLSGYLSEILCYSNQVTGQYILNHYDDKMGQLDELISFLWSNYKLLFQGTYNINDKKLVESVSDELKKLFNEIFGDADENLYYEYLSEKGFDKNYLNYLSSDNDSLKLATYGSILVYTYLPMDPLDPADYDYLVEKCNSEVKTIIEHEIDLNKKLYLVKCGQENLDNSIENQISVDYLNKLEIIKHDLIYRESQIDYFTIKKELQNAIKQFASFKQISKMAKNFCNFDKSVFKLIHSEYQTWISSLENFIMKLTKNYHSYIDIIYMPIAGLSLIGYSMSVLYAKWLLKHQNHNENSSIVKSLFEYPVENHLNQAKTLLKQANTSTTEISDKLYYLALLNIYSASEHDDDILERQKIFNQICFYFCERYQQELDLKIKNSEVDAYKYKEYGQKEISSELEQAEYEQMFPSYLNEFKEFHFSTSLFENPIKETSTIQVKESLTSQFLSQIFNLIESITHKKMESFKVNLKAFSNAYKIAEKLLRENDIYLERNEKSPYLSHILYAILEKSGQDQDDLKLFKKYYSIYKDSNQAEVVKCKNVLNEYKARLNSLLIEWPDNSILLELGKICKRIESFHLNESLIKYLTGLELLVQKSESWQLIASKAHSLDNELKLISSLIVEWRKLELNCWKESLELEAQNIEFNCSFKWFSHVFTVCNEYFKTPEKSNELFMLFKQFMETSPIGEYEIRLRILRLCFLLFKDKKESILSTLWNVTNYFESYLNLILAKILEKKTEIEKELKDFVKICRWQDMNYWALKQSTDKSHKTLFKLIKKFKDFLNTNVNEYLIIQKYHFIAQPFNSKNVKISFQSDYPYAMKMQKFCEKLLRKKFNLPLFGSLDLFTSVIYDRFNELAKQTKSILSVEKTKENKEAHKKEMKNLQLQKRKSLSDLFKELALIGLSYRRGNIELKAQIKDISSILVQKPSNLNEIAYKNNIESEYYSCVSRYLAYKEAQNTPEAQRDLKTLQIEQLDGYLHHLMFITNDQKVKLHDFYENLTKFKNYKQTVEVIAKSNIMGTNNHERITQIRQLVVNSKSLLDETILFFSVNNNSQIESHYNQMKTFVEHVNLFLNKINGIISNLNDEDDLIAKIKASFVNNEMIKNISMTIEEFSTLFTPNIEHLIHLNEDFLEIKRLFETIKTNTYQAVDILTSLKDTSEEPIINNEDSNESKFIDKCLKNIENLYKKYFKNKNNGDNFAEEHESLFDFTSKCFLNECYSNFEHDIKLLSISKCNNLLKSHIFKAINQGYNSTKALFNKIYSFIEIYYDFSSKLLEVLSSLHLKSCKLTNVILFVFTEIRTKGFCTPQDFEMEETEETNDEKCENFSDDAKGLGEGQGKKDVSDQIETEDQLEDAKRKNDYENQNEDDEDENMTEEKNGIEMTDDFEGKLNDKEPEEGEQKEGEEEDDDQKEMEDQMGDVDDTANDVLDERLWGDEGDDEEDNKDKEVEEDAKNGGEVDKSKTELGAKQEELPMIDKGADADEEKEDEDNEESGENDDQINDEEAKFIEDVEDQPENGSNETKDQPPLDENTPTEDEEIKMDTNENKDEQVEEPEEGEKLGEDPEIENINEEQLENDENSDKIEPQEQMEVDLLEEEQQDKKSKDYIADQTAFNEQQKQENNHQNNNTDNNQQQNAYEEDEESGETTNNKNLGAQKQQKQKKKKDKNKPDEKRTMGNPEEEDNKKIESTVDVDENNNDDIENDEEAKNENQVDFKHVQDENEKYDKQIRDAATDNQKQKLKNKENTEEDQEKMDIENEKIEDEEEKQQEKEENDKPKSLMQKNLKNQEKLDNAKNIKSEKDLIKNEKEIEIDGEKILTHSVEANAESIFVTNTERLFIIQKIRDETEKKLFELRNTETNEEHVNQDALALWHNYDILTQQYSKELCEQLRLILEPTKCSKLKGDYKTGKRLNMKRVIEYIATEYRKDKIWLRRTKPNDRTYQIMLAIDNSSSMGDNHCVQLAYESIATLINAFNYLQVGQFGLLSFGESVNVLHSLQDPLNSDIGAKIFSQINFKDKKTKVAHMLNCAVDAFDASQSTSDSNSNALSKLLIILSDGRGVFFEGLEYVKNCVQQALQKKVFIVFIILDITGKNTSSIYDIKMPIFEQNNPVS